MKNRLLLAILLLLPVFAAHARPAAPLALVFKGAGTCFGCSASAKRAAEKAGFQARYITVDEIDEEHLQGASLWVQPGGYATTVAEQMTPPQKALVRGLIEGGAGYVGLCAGAFLADSTVDDDGRVDGLAILPMATKDHLPKTRRIVPVIWEGKLRHIYFHEGASFVPSSPDKVTVIATYADDQTPAVVETAYGKGKVVVSGVHPEAPSYWKLFLHDADGSDMDLAVELMHRAAPAF